jgi:hypothetical protein
MSYYKTYELISNKKINSLNRSFFLSLDTDGFSSSAGGFGVLTSDLKTPLVSETSVGSDLE